MIHGHDTEDSKVASLFNYGVNFNKKGVQVLLLFCFVFCLAPCSLTKKK